MWAAATSWFATEGAGSSSLEEPSHARRPKQHRSPRSRLELVPPRAIRRPSLTALDLAVKAAVEGSDAEKEQAAADLCLMAHDQWTDPDDRDCIAEAGGVGPLVALAEDGTVVQKEHAATALCVLTFCNDSCRDNVASAGGIDALVTLAAEGTDVQREEAAVALCNLAHKPEHKANIAKAGGIAPLVKLVCEGTATQKEHGAAALHNLACCSTSNKDLIARAGGITPLLALVRAGTPGQKEEAAAAINILAHSPANKKAIAEANGVPPLIALARGGTASQVKSACAALRSLALDNDTKELIEDRGGPDVEQLIEKSTSAATPKSAPRPTSVWPSLQGGASGETSGSRTRLANPGSEAGFGAEAQPEKASGWRSRLKRLLRRGRRRDAAGAGLAERRLAEGSDPTEQLRA